MRSRVIYCFCTHFSFFFIALLETGGLLRLAVKLMQAASDSTVYVTTSKIAL